MKFSFTERGARKLIRNEYQSIREAKGSGY